MIKIRKLFLPIFACIVFSTIFAGCIWNTANIFNKDYSVKNRSPEFKNISDLDGNGAFKALDDFYFVVISDVHIGFVRTAQGGPFFLSQLDKLRAKGIVPKFCLALGDLVNYGIEKEFLQFEELSDKIENDYNIKMFNSIGNHDVYSDGYKYWKKYNYPHTSLYKFQAGKFSFYSLDTATGNMGTLQLKILKSEMEKDSNYKVVFSHYPIFTVFPYFKLDDTTERNLLLNLYARNNVKLVLCGHHHAPELLNFGSFKSYVVGSLGYHKDFMLFHVKGTEIERVTID